MSITYTISALQSKKNDPKEFIPRYTDSKTKAKLMAKKFSLSYHYVFVEYYNIALAESGYLNKNGYNKYRENWSGK